MKEMLIQPFKSVGILCLNEKRQEIREKINEAFETQIHEFGDGKEYVDFFPDRDFLVHYDEKDHAIAFEFFEAGPVFNEISLLTIPFVKLVEMFSSIDSGLFVDETMMISNKYGIAGHCSYKGEDGMLPSESVLIFKQGYYD